MLESLFLVSALAVAGPAPLPVEPAVPAVTRRADVTIEDVDVKASDRTELRGSFYVPKGSGRAPAALLIHGAGGDRAGLTDQAEALWKAGYAVLTLDLRGHGDSIADPEDAYAALTEDVDKARAWAFATRDVEAAARWLRGNKRVHTSNLTVVGFGEGSALAARQAVNDENVRAVALVAPKREMLGFDLVEDLLELEGLPVVLFASRESRDRVQDLADEIHDELGSKDFIEVDVCKAKIDTEILADKKFPATLSRPLKEIAFPKRGRR